jgi:hypothetical protein
MNWPPPKMKAEPPWPPAGGGSASYRRLAGVFLAAMNSFVQIHFGLGPRLHYLGGPTGAALASGFIVFGGIFVFGPIGYVAGWSAVLVFQATCTTAGRELLENRANFRFVLVLLILSTSISVYAPVGFHRRHQELAVADSRQSSPEVLRGLYERESGDPGVVAYLANNPRCPPDLLVAISRNAGTDDNIRRLVEDNPSAPPGVPPTRFKHPKVNHGPEYFQ